MFQFRPKSWLPVWIMITRPKLTVAIISCEVHTDFSSTQKITKRKEKSKTAALLSTACVIVLDQTQSKCLYLPASPVKTQTDDLASHKHLDFWLCTRQHVALIEIDTCAPASCGQALSLNSECRCLIWFNRFKWHYFWLAVMVNNIVITILSVGVVRDVVEVDSGWRCFRECSRCEIDSLRHQQ